MKQVMVQQLLQSLPKQFLEGAKVVSAGANPVDIQRGIKLGEQAVRNSIREMSIGLNSENQAMVEMVATISANNDSVMVLYWQRPSTKYLLTV